MRNEGRTPRHGSSGRTSKVVSASSPMTLREYVDSIGDARLVIDMLVGALQRLLVYPAQGFMISQQVPDDVLDAYDRLSTAGYTSRLLRDSEGNTLRPYT
ncbi:hypothetical protein SVEN_4007 [Streptomyces venezuelae ATCC 10712]|uniref:Uncharacterized protein n=1 Tax=Streptomyces venezuelae (strain ATCC 10712 / CBS 650.69 / DSM 40230 / JCM 4526 / NBRC 13096 / PD 04745) TaxID=953739 RepID=F2RFZ1_STRVP|nr:hypothetical protein SVEN_4007 [Streptomyces venezuelae ATCC 10712]